MTDPAPKFTFLLLAYNQARWIGEALAGAFAQTYGPLEIIINDDGSTDATQQIIRKAVAEYRGPHSVRVNFNPANIGLIASVNQSFHRATAPFIVVAAGDDISEPTRVQVIAEVLANQPDIHAIVSDAIAIDEAGAEIGFLNNRQSPNDLTAQSLAEGGGYVNGAAAGYSRSLIERFGELDPSIWSEDSLLPFRAALLGRIVHIPQPLIRRRIHANSLSGAASSREGLLRTMRPAVSAFHARLADIEQPEVRIRHGELGVRNLRAAIGRAIERQKIYIALMERNSGALRSLFEAVCAKSISPASALKTLLVYRFQPLWRSYLFFRGLTQRFVPRRQRSASQV